MTYEQKQKVLQLLELCIDNSKKGEYAELDAAIEAIRTLPERATALLSVKEAARRDKLIKEYEEVFGKKN